MYLDVIIDLFSDSEISGITTILTARQQYLTLLSSQYSILDWLWMVSDCYSY